MPAEIGGVERHHHEVAGARLDGLVAAGAEVALGRLVGLDAPDLYLGLRPRPHANNAAVSASAATTIT